MSQNYLVLSHGAMFTRKPNHPLGLIFIKTSLKNSAWEMNMLDWLFVGIQMLWFHHMMTSRSKLANQITGESARNSVSIRGRGGLSVLLSVHPLRVIFERNEIIINDTMSDEEVVASDVSRRFLLHWGTDKMNKAFWGITFYLIILLLDLKN